MKDKYVIISYPKAGRTWLRLMLGKLFVSHYKIAIDHQNLLLNIRQLSMIYKKSPLIKLCHGRIPSRKESEIAYGTPEEMTLLEKYYNHGVIFLVRDPRDIIVSAYTVAQDKYGFQGTISDFIYRKQDNIDCIIKFFNMWYKGRDKFKDFLFVKYEDLHLDCLSQIKRILEFVNVKDVFDSEIKNSIRFCSLKNMKAMETSSFFSHYAFNYCCVGAKRGYCKIRKGEAKSYGKYLSNKEIAYMDQKIRDDLNPVFWY